MVGNWLENIVFLKNITLGMSLYCIRINVKVLREPGEVGAEPVPGLYRGPGLSGLPRRAHTGAISYCFSRWSSFPVGSG